jgi:signal peptidase II
LQNPNNPNQKRTDIFRSLLILATISLVIFISDQLTKRLIVRVLEPGQSLSPIPGLERIFQFTYITNTGAAFGLFPNWGNMFILIALIVVIGIVYYFPAVDNKLVQLSLGLQLGGAVGNLWDRIFNNGHVIDYVDIGFWPIFNIADISIVTGVILLAFWLWQVEDQQAHPK